MISCEKYLGDPITDWLDVTYSPSDSVYAPLRLFLFEHGYYEKYSGSFAHEASGGLIRLDETKTYSRISFSGSSIRGLESLGLWGEVLALMAESPHRVTRLDVALDVLTEFPEVLAGLREKSCDGRFSLHGRKSLRTDMWLTRRPDGVDTGTFYVGMRSQAKVTAKVYDKAWERSAKGDASMHWAMPLTRYEITVRSQFGATLRDAYSPTSLFWHLAADPFDLPCPSGVAAWVPVADLGWSRASSAADPIEVALRLVDSSPVFDRLRELCFSDGSGAHGHEIVSSAIARRLRPAVSLPEAQAIHS